jgi:hypothetical protein
MYADKLLEEERICGAIQEASVRSVSPWLNSPTLRMASSIIGLASEPVIGFPGIVIGIISER